MTAPAFTKFDPRAFLEDEEQGGTAAKPAKVAKASELRLEPSGTLATLATLAGDQATNKNVEPTSHTWTDAEEERAAIVEYDGGAPRAWAEALARLDPNKPPEHVPPHRWLRFIDDCGRFLDGGWADKAAKFGWGPFHLFGCDRARPYARNRGLLWEINGGRLIELDRNRAIIETRWGAQLYYRCRPLELGRVVLAWELIA
jgi:hypothetical protein